MDRRWARWARCPSGQSNPGAYRALNGRGKHGGGGPGLQAGEDVHYYQKVLALDPQNSLATKGFSLIADRYLALANQAFAKGQDTKATQYVTWGLLVQEDHPELLAFQTKLTQCDGKLTGSVDRLFRSVNGIFKYPGYMAAGGAS